MSPGWQYWEVKSNVLTLELDFGNLIPTLGGLTQSLCRGRSLVLSQLDAPCVDSHERPAHF